MAKPNFAVPGQPEGSAYLSILYIDSGSNCSYQYSLGLRDALFEAGFHFTLLGVPSKAQDPTRRFCCIRSGARRLPHKRQWC